MPIPVSAAASPSTTIQAAAAAPTSGAGPSQEMDREMFMKLLVAQLQNQDPSAPMDTNQMISQASQLATNETLSNIAQTLASSLAAQGLTTASALMGAQINWAEAGQTGQGKVTGAQFIQGRTYLELEDVDHLVDAASVINLTR